MGSLNDSIIVSATALLTFWDGCLFGEVPCVVGCPAAPLAPLPSVDGHTPTNSQFVASSCLLMLSNVPWVPQLLLVENYYHR